MGENGILVVGGYGVVGRRISSHLASAFPGKVLIAGRDGQRATSASVETGYGATGRRVDATDPTSIERALDGVGAVISCVALTDMSLLRASIDRGLAYTDIAPRLAFWDGAEELDEKARGTGARVVLGAGLSPGISNLMARQLADALGRVDCIETAILLSLGDEYGRDSLKHVLEAVRRPFTILENGEPRKAFPFREGRRVPFPEPFGSRVAYLFPWSDVVFYRKTLGARTALGRFTLDPPWAGHLASALMSSRARSWLLRPGVLDGKGGAIDRLRRLCAGRDGFALVVTAEGRGRIRRMSLSGRGQAEVTAVGAAEVARALVEDEVHDPGVWLPEEVISSHRFFGGIALRGYEPHTEETMAGATEDEVMATHGLEHGPSRPRLREPPAAGGPSAS